MGAGQWQGLVPLAVLIAHGAGGDMLFNALCSRLWLEPEAVQQQLRSDATLRAAVQQLLVEVSPPRRAALEVLLTEQGVSMDGAL